MSKDSLDLFIGLVQYLATVDRTPNTLQARLSVGVL